MKKLIILLLGIIIVSCSKETKEVIADYSAIELRSTDEFGISDEINIQVNGEIYNTLEFGELHNDIVVNSFPSISDSLNLLATGINNINNYLNSKPSNKYVLTFGNTAFDSNHIDFLGKRSNEQLARGVKNITLLQDSLFMIGFLNTQERDIMVNFIAEIFNINIPPENTLPKFIDKYNLIYGSSLNSSNNSSLSQIYVATFIGMIIHSKSLWINWDYEENPCFYRNTSGKIVEDIEDITNTHIALNPILLDAGGGLVKTWIWIIRNRDRIESNEDLGREFGGVIVDNVLNSSTVGMWGVLRG